MAVPTSRRAAFAGAFLALATRVSAHGIATALVQWPQGIYYSGYNPSYQYQKPAPVVVGWSTPDDLSNTFISPKDYTDPDIACHLKATPAGAHAPVSAGDVLAIRWAQWPASHHGPVIDYLANCNGPCTSADKTKLKFFKIDEVGLLDASKELWGADVLLQNNLTWHVRIPLDIAPGNYVLRHEMIALHAAGNKDGAQNYPFCFSLAISGDGTKNPDGVLATNLYKNDHPGILFDLFRKYSTYSIPGPSLYSGALSVAQSKPVAPKSTGTGIAAYVAVAKPTPAAAATTSAVASAATSAAPAATSSAATVATSAATTHSTSAAKATPVPSAPKAGAGAFGGAAGGGFGGGFGMGAGGGFRTSTRVMTVKSTTTRSFMVTLTTTRPR